MINTESIIIIIICVIIILYINNNNNNTNRLIINNNKVLFTIINDTEKINKQKIILMSKVINNMYLLRDYLYDNINLYPEYYKYIKLLYLNFNKNKTNIYETNNNDMITSYTINKGEKVFLCIKNKNDLDDINTIMYVAIHEMAHIACPTIGHDNLFKYIFKFLIECSIIINIYKHDNYNHNPVKYCNTIINSYIL